MTPIRRGWVYLADLNPSSGTEPGKIRPVLVVQTDLINGVHPSTVICPLTTNLSRGARRLRVRLLKDQAGLDAESDVLIDQVRAIDNRRLLRPLGKAPAAALQRVGANLAVVLDIAREEPPAPAP